MHRGSNEPIQSETVTEADESTAQMLLEASTTFLTLL